MAYKRLSRDEYLNTQNQYTDKTYKYKYDKQAQALKDAYERNRLTFGKQQNVIDSICCFQNL